MPQVPTQRTLFLRACVAMAAVLFSITSPSVRAADWTVEDIFGRRVTERGLTLVDWEGPIANPAIKFFIVPPKNAAFPLRVFLSTAQTRAYFNLPSKIGARGPSKVVDFPVFGKQPVFVSIFTNREAKDLDFSLQLRCQDSAGRKQTLSVPCHVIDQDKKDEDREESKLFPITVDFSQDRTGFFKDEKKRRIVLQAARDWAYFLAPESRDIVPAGAEKTHIWNSDGFKSGKVVDNAREYAGYLLYAYGIKGAELRSGGEPSQHGGWQSQGGKELPLRRSGGFEAEIRGNYNTKGWMLSLADGDYWKATNERNVPNDFYSIAHHEIGHALFFNPANSRFDRAKKNGKLEDPVVRAYFASNPRVSQADHFEGSIDPESLCGAFGNEYHGDVPHFRWQITKLDLLCAKAVGYTLRPTSAFAPLNLETDALLEGAVGQKYAASLRATGGIPIYNWEITGGSLPAGVRLDSFGGTIRGTPTKAGVFDVTVRVRDYHEKGEGQSRKVQIKIAAGS
jgi:hypothetical protein